MAVQLGDVSSPAGLKKLDEYLLTRSYVSGYQASRDDLTVYAAISSPPDSKLVNVSRWYLHITGLLGPSFAGVSSGVKISGTPSSSATRDFTPAPAPPTPEAVPVTAAAAPAAEDDDDDDDLDLFGEETEEEKAASAKREAEKKASGKKAVVGKSSVLMDVKPWDDETDMKLLEEAVRSVHKEGLTWGASKLVPVGYGIKKLQVLLTVVDDLVSLDELIEDDLCAEPRNEYIQSCDIVAFNKICKCSPSMDENTPERFLLSVCVPSFVWNRFSPRELEVECEDRRSIDLLYENGELLRTPCFRNGLVQECMRTD